VGFIIGMAILWGLTLIVINPLVNYIVDNKMREEGVFVDEFGALPPDEQKYWEKYAGRTYIMVDMLVLGVAGFLMGYILGLWLIGISFSAKGWPGMLAFIALSFLGASLRMG
jgi:hypothetical protein